MSIFEEYGAFKNLCSSMYSTLSQTFICRMNCVFFVRIYMIKNLNLAQIALRKFRITLNTDSPLYIDTRYNDKFRCNDNLTVTNLRLRDNN